MQYKGDFKELYSMVRRRHPSLIGVDDSIVHAMGEELRDAQKSENTLIYIIAVSCSVFFCATYPLLIARAYRLARLLQTQLASMLSQREFLGNHPEIIVTCLLVLLVVPFYTMVLPHFRRIWNPLFKGEFPPDIKKRGKKFILYILIVNYLVVFIPLLFLYSYTPISEFILKGITIVWLMLPLIIICTLPTCILLIILVLLFGNKFIVSNPSYISYGLLQLLNLVDEVQGLADLKHHQKQNIVNSIVRISYMIKTLYKGSGLMNGSTQWSVREMERAGDNFLSLSSWIYFPQPNTLENLRKKMCSYLNIFLSGHYHELPREKMGEHTGIILVEERIAGLRRFIGLLFFAGYLGFPIAIFAAVTALFHIDVPPLIQSAFNILYITWVAFGFFHFSEKLAPDAKSLLIEVIKSLIQKK